MKILYPNSYNKVDSETKKILLERMLVSAVIFVLLQSLNFSIYWTVVCVFTIAAVNGVMESATYYRKNTKILHELMEFINSLVFNYRYEGIIEEALEDTIMNASYDMALHANYIYELITREDYEDTLEQYKILAPNAFFLMFYSICYMVKQQGDKDINGQSLFVSNMNRLMSDINDEIVKQEKIRYLFSGLFGVSLAPIFAIKPIEIWAEYNLPELTSYYNSRNGVLVSVLLAVITLMVFTLVKKMRYPQIVDLGKSKLICKLTQKSIVKEIQMLQIEKNYSRYMRRATLLKKSGCRYNVREFQVLQLCSSMFTALIIAAATLSMELGVLIVVLISVMFAVIAYFLPYISVLVSYESLKENMIIEVTRLQSVIIMCMYQEHMDVLSLLTHMEMAAIYFKTSISKAIDEYDGSGMESLENLKSIESNKAFIRIVDGLMACDNFSCDKAFDFIEKDREYDIGRWKMKQNKILADRAAIGKFLSFVPMASTIGLKLIIPFVLEGMSRLVTYTNEFQTML